MKVYILTEEPLDGAIIIGVYLSEDLGIAKLREIQSDPKMQTIINGSNYILQEWDVDLNQSERRWELVGEHIKNLAGAPWTCPPHKIAKKVGTKYILEGPGCSS